MNIPWQKAICTDCGNEFQYSRGEPKPKPTGPVFCSECEAYRQGVKDASSTTREYSPTTDEECPCEQANLVATLNRELALIDDALDRANIPRVHGTHDDSYDSYVRVSMLADQCVNTGKTENLRLLSLIHRMRDAIRFVRTGEEKEALAAEAEKVLGLVNIGGKSPKLAPPFEPSMGKRYN